MQSIYWHLTTWQQGGVGLEVGARHTTAWEESNYWQSKREQRQIDDARSSLAKSIGGLRDMLASPLGRLLKVQNVPDELREGVELMQRGADQAAIDRWVDQVAQSKLQWEWEKEQQFERIREREFAALPSRRRCMFLLDRGATPAAFATKYAFPASRLLLGVEPVAGESTLFRADIGALDVPRVPVKEVEARARSYWAGAADGHDPLRVEVLLEGAFVIRSIEPLAAYLEPAAPTA